MTDDEIIKALASCHEYSDCWDCKYGKFRTGNGLCIDILHREAADLLNRQKAEIKKLIKGNQILSRNADTAFQDGLNEAQELYTEQIKKEVRTETIKEFAERLKESLEWRTEPIDEYDIDNLVKEMTEGKEN